MKNLLITIVMLFIFAGLNSCEDSLGLDDYERENVFKKDTVFIEYEPDTVLVRDTIPEIVRDTVMINDTLYDVRIDTMWRTIQPFYHINYDIVETHIRNSKTYARIRWNPLPVPYLRMYYTDEAIPRLICEIDMTCIYASSGIPQYPTEYVKSIRLEVDKYPLNVYQNINLNGDKNSDHYSRIEFYHDGEIEIYDGKYSPVKMKILPLEYDRNGNPDRQVIIISATFNSYNSNYDELIWEANFYMYY